MTEPIPAEVMEEARKLLREGNCVACIDDIYCCCFDPLCEALFAAEKRGEQQERERCARVAQSFDNRTDILKISGYGIASAIRSPT